MFLFAILKSINLVMAPGKGHGGMADTGACDELEKAMDQGRKPGYADAVTAEYKAWGSVNAKWKGWLL